MDKSFSESFAEEHLVPNKNKNSTYRRILKNSKIHAFIKFLASDIVSKPWLPFFRYLC